MRRILQLSWLFGSGLVAFNAAAVEQPDVNADAKLMLAQATNPPAPAAAPNAVPADAAPESQPRPSAPEGGEGTTPAQAANPEPAPPAPPPAAVAPAPAPAEAAPAATPVVGDVTFHGYFRMGWGMSSEKGRQTCFQAPGAMSKFRLGNECDQYGEFLFKTPIYVAKDGMVATAYFMPALYIPTTTVGYQSGAGGINSGYGQGWNGSAWNFPFMYMDMKNVPGLAGGTPWVGRRYYKREDWHSTDFFYWNPSGLGAGIEDIQLGEELRLSYAAFAVDPPSSVAPAGAPANAPLLPPQNAMGIRNDIQLRGIRLYPGGELQLGLNLIANWADSGTGTHSGWGVIVRHVQDIANGSNKLTLQYGQGSGIGFGIPDYYALNSDSSRIRVVDVLTVDLNDDFGVQAGLVYQHDKGPNDTKQDWISVGARGSYAFSDHGKIVLDVGHDNVKTNDADRVSLTKITLAPTLSAGRGVMTRPELRLFGTLAMWNDAARSGVDSAGVYANTDKKMGATFGVHSEVWW